MESSPHPYGLRLPRLWPGLWVPLIILITGLAITAIAATIEANRARELAEARYHAQHQAMVNLLLARARHLPTETAPADVRRTEWLRSLFDEALPPGLGLRIDTLERFTKQPLIQLRVNGSIDPTRTLRTEVNSGDARWLLTTVPDPSLLQGAARQASNTAWFTGLGLTAMAALFALLLCRRLHDQSLILTELQKEAMANAEQITNLQVEKAILRRALNDSEQRSRDLVGLSGATICELDEAAAIGFISAQIIDLIERAPADLAGVPFESLIEPSAQENFRRALRAARTEHSMERIDLSLLHRDGDTRIPVVVRIRALRDTIHGLTGYRLSALPNHPGEQQELKEVEPGR